jgi:hypothetical protein
MSDVKRRGCVVVHVMGGAPYPAGLYSRCIAVSMGSAPHLCSRCIVVSIGSAPYLKRLAWWMCCHARDGERSLSQMSGVVNVLSWT